jgi:putative transcriptional regulator
METMKEHSCNDRRAKRLATKRAPFHFVDCGLPNVYLVGIRYFVCECGKTVAEIPAAKQLMASIARDLVESNQALTGDEIRFLRKRLGKKATDFARELGIESEHLSRLENGKKPVAEPMGKLIRLVYAVSANDSELLNRVVQMVGSLLVSWSKREENLKIVKKIDENEWSDAIAA